MYYTLFEFSLNQKKKKERKKEKERKKRQDKKRKHERGMVTKSQNLPKGSFS